MDLHDFFMGRWFDAYRFFGAHPEDDHQAHFTFRTFAPAAKRITVTGDFNNWGETEMGQDNRSGVFTVTGVAAKPGDFYKFRVYTQDGCSVEHSDPYGFQMELRPGMCSILTDFDSYTFNDGEWMARPQNSFQQPLNIYEIHLGSWRKKSSEAADWYTYRQLAGPLVEYVKTNHYTHVELMPLSEHPFDGSWGYQNTGFFAPTSRYGNPDDLKYFIDQCHQNNIGVIMDFVPVHFAVDSYGLKKFDGTHLYEYPSPDVGESEWGSYNFLHDRPAVRCFLQSAANYWLEEFHFDGLRFDAVSRLIYWQGDEKRGVNGTTLEFLKFMNKGLKERHPSALLIAEDSSPYPNVTKPVAEGGLGFDYKWDLGWMHDTLDYFNAEPVARPANYHKLTFSMMYFYNEKYVLPYSHDENVHGKATILQKMWGDYRAKFSQARAMYLYMMVHPGKKLNFMGGEIGQLREWDENKEQDWLLLDYPVHDSFHQYIICLNEIYLKSAALHDDFNPKNFRWADCNQQDRSIYAILRSVQDEALLAVFNFSDQAWAGYSLILDGFKNAGLILHSESERWSGAVSEKEKIFDSDTVPDSKLKLTINLAPFSAVLFKLA